MGLVGGQVLLSGIYNPRRGTLKVANPTSDNLKKDFNGILELGVSQKVI